MTQQVSWRERGANKSQAIIIIINYVHDIMADSRGRQVIITLGLGSVSSRSAELGPVGAPRCTCVSRPSRPLISSLGAPSIKIMGHKRAGQRAQEFAPRHRKLIRGGGAANRAGFFSLQIWRRTKSVEIWSLIETRSCLRSAPIGSPERIALHSRSSERPQTSGLAYVTTPSTVSGGRSGALRKRRQLAATFPFRFLPARRPGFGAPPGTAAPEILVFLGSSDLGIHDGEMWPEEAAPYSRSNCAGRIGQDATRR